MCEVSEVRKRSVFRGEEHFLTRVLPRRLNRPGIICGDALFGHFAFFTQRDYLEKNTDLLQRYRAHSFKISEHNMKRNG
jgi:hypothetical protein